MRRRTESDSSPPTPGGAAPLFARPQTRAAERLGRRCLACDLSHRVEANMEWLVAAARAHRGSQPESYGISDAEDAHAELEAILRGVAPDG